jgi:hypothetical protein
MREVINHDRRRFLGTVAMTITTARLSTTTARAETNGSKLAHLPSVKPGTNVSFASLKQIDAGLLNVGYAEAGPIDGPPVVLLHVAMARRTFLQLRRFGMASKRRSLSMPSP